MSALAEQVQIEVGQGGREGVRVVELGGPRAGSLRPEPVGRSPSASRQHGLEQARRVDALHWGALGARPRSPPRFRPQYGAGGGAWLPWWRDGRPRRGGTGGGPGVSAGR